jgi:ATP-binding cassette subfamily C (CFTR/MRP) protein 1
MLAAGGWPAVIQVCLCFLLEAGLRAGTDAWVGVWATGEGGLEVWAYILAYFALGIAFSVAVGVRSYTLLYKMVTASLKLHNDLLLHVMRLPVMFFDTNPSGRIVNRFSRDMEIIDSTLNASIIQLMGCMSNVMITVVMVTVAAAASPTPYVIIGWLPIVALYVMLQRYFVPTSRETQRLESVSRSPIYAHFGESVNGIKTIQAFNRQKQFIAISDELMDLNAAAYMTKCLSTEWLNMRLDFVGMLIGGMAAFLSASGGVGVVFTGLILTYALEVPKFLKFGTMMASRVESDFNSVERILQYMKVDTEADEDTPPEVRKGLPPAFPSKSTLEFRNYSMRYRDGLPLVLKNVSFTVADGEKIGIVGRTGSGKSSILVSIFRIVEGSSGSILLDGIDISTLGLRDLRASMCMIPQDPFLFSGTLRENIDPFSAVKDDKDVWDALDMVGLKSVVGTLPEGLATVMSDGGSNFSQGQRQLICMARALLRNARVLMLDEATASIDLETDNKIQTAIRTAFSHCTVLTIAHRLDTVMDSDRIIVMEKGVVAEIDVPKTLLDKEEGALSRLVTRSGNADRLKSIASKSYDNLLAVDTKQFLP